MLEKNIPENFLFWTLKNNVPGPLFVKQCSSALLNYWANPKSTLGNQYTYAMKKWGQIGQYRTLYCQGEVRNVLQIRNILDWANPSRGRKVTSLSPPHSQGSLVAFLFALPCVSVHWSSCRWRFFSTEIACLGVSMTTRKGFSEPLRSVLLDLNDERLCACKGAMLLVQPGKLQYLCLPHFPITLCSFYRQREKMSDISVLQLHYITEKKEYKYHNHIFWK